MWFLYLFLFSFVVAIFVLVLYFLRNHHLDLSDTYFNSTLKRRNDRVSEMEALWEKYNLLENVSAKKNMYYSQILEFWEHWRKYRRFDILGDIAIVVTILLVALWAAIVMYLMTQ